jgi:peptidoglycan/xylan/chitin deacetylase (PgdA/CDA1 family)
MRLFKRIERKILQFRTRIIYLHSKQAQIKSHNLEKGIVTIFHDYERHYHEHSVSEYSDNGIRELLKIEKKHGVIATYNIVAKLLGDVRSIIVQIKNDRHEIASHSYSHSIIGKMTKDQINRDIQLTEGVFRKNGLQLDGLRCPQSRWSFKQLPIMLQYGMKWSAENDKADFPYAIFRNRTKTALLRMPIKMDDWAYEESNISPNEMHQRLFDCVENIADKKIYGAIGFHPWVQGKDVARIKVFDDFIQYLAKNEKITLMTFGQSYNQFS